MSKATIVIRMNGMSAMPPPGFSRSDIKEDMAILSCLAFSAGWLPRYVGDGVTLDAGSAGRKLLLHPAPLSLLVAGDSRFPILGKMF
jgi:hypothetical protein